MLHRTLTLPAVSNQFARCPVSSQRSFSSHAVRRTADSSASVPLQGRGRGSTTVNSKLIIGGITVNAPPPLPQPVAYRTSNRVGLTSRQGQQRLRRPRPLQLSLAGQEGGLSSRLAARSTPQEPAIPKQQEVALKPSAATSNETAVPSSQRQDDQFADAPTDTLEHPVTDLPRARAKSFSFDLTDFDPIPTNSDHTDRSAESRPHVQRPRNHQRINHTGDPTPDRARFTGKPSHRTSPRGSRPGHRLNGSPRRTPGQGSSSRGLRKLDGDAPYTQLSIGEDPLSYGYSTPAPSVVLLPHHGDSVWVSGMRAGCDQGSRDSDYVAQAQNIWTQLTTSPDRPMSLPGIGGRFNIIPSPGQGELGRVIPLHHDVAERGQATPNEAIGRAVEALNQNASLTVAEAVKAARVVTWGVASREERMGWLVKEQQL